MNHCDFGKPQAWKHGWHYPKWSQLLVTYLENALVHTNTYTAKEIGMYIDFFMDTIGPHLGPGPLSLGSGNYQPQYPSAMTKDLTPFELSLCWKERKQQGKPIVRFINNIILFNAERTRTASLAQTLHLVDSLQKVAEDESSNLTLHLLPEIWKAVSKYLYNLEPRLHPQGGCLQCGSSSAFVGFDLKRMIASGKFYWRLPSCLDVPGALELMDSIFTACGPKNFNAWEEHLNLNGSVACPNDFRSTCRDLWTSLTTNPDEWAKSRPEAGPEFCLILHELTASSFSPSPTANGASGLRQSLSSKLYVLCQEIPRPDSFIVAQLLRHCNLAADSSILKVLANAAKPTNFISEISLAPRKDGTELSIYLSPSFFARKNWVAAADGYMAKPCILCSPDQN
ncbi:uncharacterized protein EURHEDRAFT_518724 [Aspergillus ruber CBS 135680]|uniref:Uncharacterized protein n=1 Tax=Aspergillus ruber (strain CBS 135680) TaxID=1388766 RepID=A0A017S295_ASPRC|nr:uncharacterized protein EURHEDRAFT_518724 [Aspergillus ruber CBS 135680]EYE90956.1 hypothetical protein EURHEDRAFT_518724 [Aspergillus ruber CBS 135680]